MRNTVLLSLLASIVLPCNAQRVLSLDSCRAMALRTNKQVAVARMKQDVATNTRRAARTKYLPKVDAVGGYELLSKEVSLLNDDQKAALNNLGTNLVNGMSGSLTQTITGLAQQGLITPQQAQAFGQMASQSMPQLANTLNGVGTDIRRAFRTNNRNMMGLSVMVRQPVYLGGAITAANRIADINEQMMFFQEIWQKQV